MHEASASGEGRRPPILAADHEQPGHAPGPSGWPIWFAASSSVAFLGLAFTEPALLVGGLLLIVAATVGWGVEAGAEWRAREGLAEARATRTPGGGTRAFAGAFIAILGASLMAALVIAAPPSHGPAGGPTGGAPTPSPSGSAAPGVSPSPGGAGTTIPLVAKNIAFGTTTLTAPANTPFTIDFDNEDAGVLHNVQIKDASGASVFRGDLVTGPKTATYAVPALPPGTYTFLCDVHPTTMTGTLTVR